MKNILAKKSHYFWSLTAPEHYQDIMDKIDAACPITLRLSAQLHTPLLIGYIHPIIYLPDYPFTEEELTFILRHEYIHWKQHHLLFKTIAHIVRLFFWWDPFFNIMYQDISQLLEIACENHLLAMENRSKRMDYLQTIRQCMIYFVQNNSQYPSVIPLLSLKKRSGIEQRYHYILIKERPSKFSSICHYLFYCYCFLLLLCTYLLL